MLHCVWWRKGEEGKSESEIWEEVKVKIKGVIFSVLYGWRGKKYEKKNCGKIFNFSSMVFVHIINEGFGTHIFLSLSLQFGVKLYKRLFSTPFHFLKKVNLYKIVFISQRKQIDFLFIFLLLFSSLPKHSIR